jgi:exodeoxyribonuclease-5
MTPRRAPPDIVARRTALTATDRSLLVEAGAGSGKTAILAGRVAVLLSQGLAPRHIAAITFTEFAASELMTRIERFVTALAGGNVPPDLEAAFPGGVSEPQRRTLEAAARGLDQLTCTTIHGFAQALIRPYPVEAGMDPGADIVDPAEADLAFTERYEAWLRAHLTGEEKDDVVAALVLGGEQPGLTLLRQIADFRRSNRDARPVPSAWSPAVAGGFATAARKFEQELNGLGLCEQKTGDACRAFIALVDVLGGAALRQAKPSNRALVAALQVPRGLSCFTKEHDKRQLKTKVAWREAAAAAGLPVARGTRAHDIAVRCYDDCHAAFDALMSAVASELLVRIAAELDELLEDWRQYKRDAALIDFDDLLHTARDLLSNEAVRAATAQRFSHVLVDEFQDTDPLQIDILWQLCGERAGGERTREKPLERRLRPGALFLVGDPKQAIYRFRGADVNAYVGAREAIGSDAVLQITANFRSVEPILDFVNGRFKAALAREAGQPGFSPLSPTCGAGEGALAVATLDVTAEAGSNGKLGAEALRDAEAERLAELCARLVGHWQIRDPETRVPRPCRYGDIALLAPVGTDLWRFEEALEGRGIPVSTQAGKGFFRRQEVQDLIALTRTLADGRDTLALGALLRGPLVGLTEAELLDIAEALPVEAGRPDALSMLRLWTDPEQVSHPLARSVLRQLQSLGSRARSTTPYLLLCDAVSELNVRAQLRARFQTGAERAQANVDLFLEMARAYEVRGLRAFAHDMSANWSEAVRQVEGRPDAEDEAVALMTIHAAKGLEWPIVIPINMTGAPRAEKGVVHDRRAGTFSIAVLGVDPAGHPAAAQQNEDELDRERVRLWYVAATRARDLVMLPRHSAPLGEKSWARRVALGLDAVAPIDPDRLPVAVAAMASPAENPQTRELFAQEAHRIVESATPLEWQRPSRDEIAAFLPSDPPVFTAPEHVEARAEMAPLAVAGSALRGTLLHKLIEEVLSGETREQIAVLEARARALMAQLGVEPQPDPSAGISPQELARTVVRALNLPEIERLRPRLVPEHTVYARADEGDGEVLISGIADAVARNGSDEIDVIVDWKSDVAPGADALASYRHQLAAYRRSTGAATALLVFVTSGTVMRV